MKRQKADDGRMIPVMPRAVHVNCYPSLRHKTISKVQLDYRRYCGIGDGDAGQLVDVSADVVKDLDDFFAKEALWEGDDESSFTADDHSLIATALARL